jgi:hypothetical protein
VRWEWGRFVVNEPFFEDGFESANEIPIHRIVKDAELSDSMPTREMIELRNDHRKGLFIVVVQYR